MRKIEEIVMRFARVSVPSSRARVNIPAWITSMSRRRSKRSAMAPPAQKKRSVGTVVINPFRPSSQAESVNSRTSHPRATDCIQVPVLERKLPAQKMAKSRCRSERKRRAMPRNCSGVEEKASAGGERSVKSGAVVSAFIGYLRFLRESVRKKLSRQGNFFVGSDD